MTQNVGEAGALLLFEETHWDSQTKNYYLKNRNGASGVNRDIWSPPGWENLPGDNFLLESYFI